MSLDRTPIVLGILFSLGGLGGFLLSLEISPAVKDAIKNHGTGNGGSGKKSAMNGTDQKEAGAKQNQSRQGSGDPHNGSGGDNGQGAASNTSLGREGAVGSGNNQAGSGNENSSQGNNGHGGPISQSSGSSQDQAPSSVLQTDSSTNDAKPFPCDFVEIKGTEAAAFLAGNTAYEMHEKAISPEVIYFAPRGLTAHFHQREMTVRAWDQKRSTVCDRDGDSASSISCDVLQVRKCLDQSNHFHIGDFRAKSGRWIPIVKGNSQEFPNYMPYFDTPPHNKSGNEQKAQKRTGHDAVAKSPFDDAVFQIYKKEAVDRDEVVFFAKSGRRFQFLVPTAEEVANGVTISTGWWKRAQNVLCEGINGASKKPLCRSLSIKGERLILRSVSDRIDTELTTVHDPKPVLVSDE